MKKYFIKGTDKEVNFGDTIKVAKSKDLGNGRVVQKYLECKVTKVTIEMLLDEGFIEEREFKEEKAEEGIQFHFEDDDCCPITCIVDAIEALGEQVDALTEWIKKLKGEEKHKK